MGLFQDERHPRQPHVQSPVRDLIDLADQVVRTLPSGIENAFLACRVE